MSRAVIGRWGKNLAIRFPVDIAAAAGLRDGERVEIAASKDEVVIRKLPAHETIELDIRRSTAESLAGALSRRKSRLGSRSRPRAPRGMSEPEYWPDAGDLVWTDFDPTIGHEQAGRRPALVVSPAAFTRNTGFAFVCPITTRIRPFPTSVVLPDRLPIAGEILLSHLRSIDALARPLRPIGAAIPAGTAAEVRAKLALLIAI